MKTDIVNRLRIASPCPISWAQMTGNDRVRFCQVCNLNVYNIAELTRSEATALVGETEGRFCARLFRRSDGTVITRDCPVGLRAVRRRVARRTAAIFATVVALSSAVFGQKPAKKDDSSCKPQVTISRKQSDTEAGVVTGTILDPVGAVVAGARIRLERKSKESHNATSDDDGCFRITASNAGVYDLVVETAGFEQLKVAQMSIASKETVNVTLILTPEATTVLVGVIGIDPMIDTSKPGGTTIITREMIQRLPIPR